MRRSKCGVTLRLALSRTMVAQLGAHTSCTRHSRGAGDAIDCNTVWAECEGKADCPCTCHDVSASGRQGAHSNILLTELTVSLYYAVIVPLAPIAQSMIERSRSWMERVQQDEVTWAVQPVATAGHAAAALTCCKKDRLRVEDTCVGVRADDRSVACDWPKVEPNDKIVHPVDS